MENDRSELRRGRKSHGRRETEGGSEGGREGTESGYGARKALGKGAFCGGVGSGHKADKIAKITLVRQRQKRPDKGRTMRTRQYDSTRKERRDEKGRI